MYYHGFCHRLYDFGGDNGSKYLAHVYCSLYNNHDHSGGTLKSFAGRIWLKLKFT